MFRGGLVCKAQRLLYLSTLGLRAIKKKKKKNESKYVCTRQPLHLEHDSKLLLRELARARLVVILKHLGVPRLHREGADE